jgi:hypothetical protein
MNKETDPQNQYVVSYNENDFYCNSIGKDVFNNILGINNEYSPTTCKTLNKNINYTKLTPHEKCVIKQICKNQEKYDMIKKIQTTHSVSTSRFQDMNSFYNTEVLNSLNLGIGIAVLSFIIYREI